MNLYKINYNTYSKSKVNSSNLTKGLSRLLKFLISILPRFVDLIYKVKFINGINDMRKIIKYIFLLKV